MTAAPPKYRGFHRGIGDVSNSPVLELLVGGEGTETYPRSLHIASADDADTDWNVAASTDPIVYVHSSTTPATDYVSLTHDATNAIINAAGATNLNLQIAGTTVAQVQANALTLPTDDDFIALGASDDFQLLWSDGDASNHAAVIAIGNTSQQIHITDVGAKATDWNISAGTHPELLIHSNTTPATDYIGIGNHDGTDAYVNAAGATNLNLQIGGTTHFQVAANALAHSAANSGAETTLTVTNSSNDASAGAEIGVVAGGASASGDAKFSALETSGHELTLGIDTSASIGVLAMNAALGSADGDAIRITDAAPPVITYNAAHPTGTFDYVCESCGAHGGQMFECCGLVEWHDDVAALAPLLGDIGPGRLTGFEPGVQHLAKLGVMEITPSDHEGEDKNFVGIRLDKAQWFTWSAMQQMYQRIDHLEKRLETVEV